MSDKAIKLDTAHLNRAFREAIEKAVRENQALKLRYRKVRDGELVEVQEDGSVLNLGKPKFGTVRVGQKSFTLED